jgi:hypothetical protein
MQGQRSESCPIAQATRTVADSPAGPVAESAIMGLLLSEDHHGLWSKEELVREINTPRLEVIDAIASLAAAGLVHELEDFVLASRAARHMDQLELAERPTHRAGGRVAAEGWPV